MNLKQRIERLVRFENLVENMQTENPYESERYKLIRKANSQLTDEEKFRECQCLKNWTKNGNSWIGIEHE